MFFVSEQPSFYEDGEYAWHIFIKDDEGQAHNTGLRPQTTRGLCVKAILESPYGNNKGVIVLP